MTRATATLAVAAVFLAALLAGTAIAGALMQGGPSPAIRIGVLHGGSYEVETLPLDAYVARVLTGEALPGSDPAALEALAITVRTYALANRGRHGADGFDLCDQTHCQVMRTATPATDRAAQATAGQILLHNGVPASVYYSASCGGRTEIPSDVWPGAVDPPYLPSHVDDGCGGAPVWSAELASGDLQRALRDAGFRGSLRTMRVAAHNTSGRVATLAVDGMSPPTISGQDLRVAVGRTLGWQHIRSTAFDLSRRGDAYRFAGHGSGHGVGLCVIGSAKLAAAGESAESILRRYFPGTIIGGTGPRLTAVPPAPPTAVARATTPAGSRPRDIVVSLPEGDEGARGGLIDVATRARDELEARLQVTGPQRLLLRVHATAGEFERATGTVWFASGAATNGEVHLSPLSALRQSGLLERTIRREVVRILIDEPLSGRPLWVKVGASLYFSNPSTATIGQEPPRAPFTRPQASPVCPSDVDLLRPVSAGALANAWAMARACVARQIEGGRSWREVR